MQSVIFLVISIINQAPCVKILSHTLNLGLILILLFLVLTMHLLLKLVSFFLGKLPYHFLALSLIPLYCNAVSYIPLYCSAFKISSCGTLLKAFWKSILMMSYKYYKVLLLTIAASLAMEFVVIDLPATKSCSTSCKE